MSAALLRRRMREQKRALRLSMARARRDAQARLAQVPEVRRARRRRRIRRSVLAPCVLLLALLTRCQCDVAPAGPPAAAVEGKAQVPALAPEPPKPLRAQIPTQPRGRLQTTTRARPAWLEDFHLQVSARSARLSRCFSGSDRPGALRWAAALDAKSGAVSDHEIEPLGAPTGFTSAQSACVVAVLSSPPYRLTVPEAEPLPNRVGLVIEF